jgi:hypothetical protein
VDSNGSFNHAAGITWDKQQQNNSGPYYQQMRDVGWNTGIYARELKMLSSFFESISD